MKGMSAFHKWFIWSSVFLLSHELFHFLSHLCLLLNSHMAKLVHMAHTAQCEPYLSQLRDHRWRYSGSTLDQISCSFGSRCQLKTES